MNIEKGIYCSELLPWERTAGGLTAMGRAIAVGPSPTAVLDGVGLNQTSDGLASLFWLSLLQWESFDGYMPDYILPE